MLLKLGNSTRRLDLVLIQLWQGKSTFIDLPEASERKEPRIGSVITIQGTETDPRAMLLPLWVSPQGKLVAGGYKCNKCKKRSLQPGVCCEEKMSYPSIPIKRVQGTEKKSLDEERSAVKEAIQATAGMRAEDFDDVFKTFVRVAAHNGFISTALEAWQSEMDELKALGGSNPEENLQPAQLKRYRQLLADGPYGAFPEEMRPAAQELNLRLGNDIITEAEFSDRAEKNPDYAGRRIIIPVSYDWLGTVRTRAMEQGILFV